MEILKPKDQLIIDEKYKPSLNNSMMDYFNRALSFSQTNYQETLDKLAKANFQSLTPTYFFDEYAWCVFCVGMSSKTTSQLYPVSKAELVPFYRSFTDFNYFPDTDPIKQNLLSHVHNEKKVDAIIHTAKIINQGIKLYNWNFYKDNYLNTVQKLQILPMIGESNVKRLSRNIGLTSEITSGVHLNRLAARWGYDSPEKMCHEIQKYVSMKPSVISTILWYASTTFGTNIPEK